MSRGIGPAPWWSVAISHASGTTRATRYYPIVYAFIDESGDPASGGRGSQWLVIGCAMVSDDHRQLADRTLRELAHRMSPGSALHFKRLTHEKKRASYSTIAQLPWWGVVAIADTTRPLPRRLRDPGTLYNDILREVVRRVLWHADETGEVPHIVIDRRLGRFNLDAFRSYLDGTSREDDAYTNWDRLDLVRLSDAEPEDEPCLCIPDGLAHAVFKKLEPNEYGDREDTYFNTCAGRLWGGPVKDVLGHYEHQRDRHLLGNGVVLFPEAEVPYYLRRGFGWLIH